jgi:hypothetical protein
MLRNRTSVRALGSLAVASLLTLAAPGASAAGGGALYGTGTISPGLTTVGTYQSFTFGGTLAYAGSRGAGTYSCGVSGSSSAPETVVSGGGSARGTCTGSAGTFSFSGSYTRVGWGAGAVMYITASAAGSVSGTLLCALELTPTSFPTEVSYFLSGSFTVR